MHPLIGARRRAWQGLPGCVPQSRCGVYPCPPTLRNEPNGGFRSVFGRLKPGLFTGSLDRRQPSPSPGEGRRRSLRGGGLQAPARLHVACNDRWPSGWPCLALKPGLFTGSLDRRQPSPSPREGRRRSLPGGGPPSSRPNNARGQPLCNARSQPLCCNARIQPLCRRDATRSLRRMVRATHLVRNGRGENGRGHPPCCRDATRSGHLPALQGG